MSKLKKILNTKVIFPLVMFLGLYFFTSGVSFAAFKLLVKPKEQTSAPNTQTSQDLRTGKMLLDISGPKTESCPIDGAKYTKVEKDAWSARRPLLIMIENHEEARPQSGITRADVVYEAVAEGGITRFLTVFYCDAQAQDVIVGPVRSARTYFLDFASEYGKYPLYAHVGGANTPGPADALGQIEKYGWYLENDLSQFSIDYPTYWRDYERLGRTVATEHTMYSSTEKLWAVAKSRNWTDKSPDGEEWTDFFKPWSFGQDADLSLRGSVSSVDFGFWDNAPKYDVSWKYDKENNQYLRTNGGQPHKDLDFDTQVTVKNVVILFMRESSANDGYENNLHLIYGTSGTGNALIFNNGNAVKGTWAKKSRLDKTQLFDDKGKEIKFVPGKIWFEILPTGNEVKY